VERHRSNAHSGMEAARLLWGFLTEPTSMQPEIHLVEGPIFKPDHKRIEHKETPGVSAELHVGGILHASDSDPVPGTLRFNVSSQYLSIREHFIPDPEAAA